MIKKYATSAKDTVMTGKRMKTASWCAPVMIARLTERMITMIVDVKTCGECKWWSDRPNVGYDRRAWARCKLTGCLTDSLFFCKYWEDRNEERVCEKVTNKKAT